MAAVSAQTERDDFEIVFGHGYRNGYFVLTIRTWGSMLSNELRHAWRGGVVYHKGEICYVTFVTSRCNTQRKTFDLFGLRVLHPHNFERKMSFFEANFHSPQKILTVSLGIASFFQTILPS